MSDEIDRLYDAECAFVEHVKQGDKEAIEAAAEIDRLRAEVERFKASLTDTVTQTQEQAAEIVRLRADNHKMTSLQKLCPCGGLESGNHFSDCPYLLALETPRRVIEIAELKGQLSMLTAENKKWREQDDAIRAEFGCKRDARPTIECLRETFAAKWSEEDALFQATLDMRTEELRAEAARLRAALKMFAEHFGPLEDNILLHDGARRCFAAARAALEEKP